MRALTLLLLTVFATLTTGASIVERHSEEVQNEVVQKRQGKPDEVETEVIKDPQGVALSVIGHYDVGLDKASSRLPARVAEAVSKFILADRTRFGLSADDSIRLVVKSVDTVDNYTVVAHVHQYVGELRVIDSDLSAAFAEDGFLQSLNGGVVPNRSPQVQPALKLERVLAILKNDTKSRTMGDLNGFQDAGRNEWRRKDGAAIMAGWSRQHKGAGWKVWLPEEIIWLDDKSGAIVRRDSQRVYGPTRGCNVRHRDWTRAANGRATSIAESAPTMVSRITCEADEWFGTCNWHLKRQPLGFSHGIARIQDEVSSDGLNGAEQEVQLPCDSNTTPSFAASNGDALREQGAFYIANQMRHFIHQNVWSQVVPNRDANVDIHLDDRTEVYPDSGRPSAHFNPFSTSIHVHQSRGQQEVLMHEYGHYVVWTYGDSPFGSGLSNNCVQGIDEGSAIHETLANVFAGIYALDSGDINPQYGAYSGLVAAPAPHTNAASLLMHDVFCTANQGDPHEKAEAFEQAVWELLFNRDATMDGATNASGHGNRIWVSESRDDVIRHVGAALGSALAVLGENITHQQVAAQMIVKIKLDSGSATANRAKSVFKHHGVL